jgi:hypothetical protein
MRKLIMWNSYMNRLPKVVCSRTLSTATWNNTTLVKDKVAVEVGRLKQQGRGDMFGRPLFSDGSKPQRLELLETRSLSTGCVILRYRT